MEEGLKLSNAVYKYALGGFVKLGGGALKLFETELSFQGSSARSRFLSRSWNLFARQESSDLSRQVLNSRQNLELSFAYTWQIFSQHQAAAKNGSWNSRDSYHELINSL